tara:strand:+ start:15401 stop:16186 length:786 start_codon:yes stop_codon:yes gene_type:complete
MKIYSVILFCYFISDSAYIFAIEKGEYDIFSSVQKENNLNANPRSDHPPEPKDTPQPHDPDNTSRNVGRQPLSFSKRDNIENTSISPKDSDYVEPFKDYATDGSVFSKVEDRLNYGKMVKDMYDRAYKLESERFEAFKEKYEQRYVRGVKTPSDSAIRVLYNSSPAIKILSDTVESAVNISVLAKTVVDPVFVPVAVFYFESDMNDKVNNSVRSVLGIGLMEGVDAFNGTTLSIMENSTNEAIKEIQSLDNSNIGCLFGGC